MPNRETPIADRRVHAECETFAIVRYERAGKWYVEPKVPPMGKPLAKKIPAAQHISVFSAAQRALSAEALGGVIHKGVPGGMVFDSKVRILRARHNQPESGAS